MKESSSKLNNLTCICIPLSALQSRFGTSSRVFLSVLLLLAVLSGFGYLSSQPILKSIAMGPGPGGCPNEYNANFTSFTVNTGTQKIDLMTNPGITFTASVNRGYNVSFVLQAGPNSTKGNTKNGSVWLGSNTYGYIFNSCYDTGLVIPKGNISLGWNVQIPYSYYPKPGGQAYYWASDGKGSSPINYSVLWIEQTKTAISCYGEINGSIACSATVAGIQPSSPPFGAPNGTVIFSTTSSGGGFCNLANTNSSNLNSDASNCSYSFTPAGPGPMNVTASYGGDYDQSSSNATAVNCCISVVTTSSSTTSTTTTSSTSTSTQTSEQSSTSSSSSLSSVDSSSSSFVSTNYSQPSTITVNSTSQSSLAPVPGGLNYTQSVAALVLSAVVIAGILSVAIRKSW